MRVSIPQPFQYGDTRIKSRFLIFPKVVNGELRWLERATWREIYSYCGSFSGSKWWASRWID